MNDFPGLTRDDIRACLAFAAARERRGVTAPPDMPAVNDYSHIITIEPGKRFGRPCIRGIRITVYDILRHDTLVLTADAVEALEARLK